MNLIDTALAVITDLALVALVLVAFYLPFAPSSNHKEN